MVDRRLKARAHPGGRGRLPGDPGLDVVGLTADRITPEMVLVRHGETEWSRDGRHTGRSDVALTEVGREEAALVGSRLRAWRFARVLTSP